MSFQFNESLVTDRTPGANGHFGSGLAAEAAIQAWVAERDEPAIYQQEMERRYGLDVSADDVAMAGARIVLQQGSEIGNGFRIAA